MRISSDGFMHVEEGFRLRTPGRYQERLEPMPPEEALSFLLSHTFPGHRRLVRPLTETERSLLYRASWTEAVRDRMCVVDRVWRAATKPVARPPGHGDRPRLVQVVLTGGSWAYPLHLDGDVTRVLPREGLPVRKLEEGISVPRLEIS